MKSNWVFTLLVLAGIFMLAAAPQPAPLMQADDATPPDQVVKLIFIHHSTGENWLRDGYGDLGRTLDQNNYFVSDTNYGWGPDAIGDRTDIPNWVEWFAGDNTPTYMNALFNENEQHASYTRTLSDPGGENEIIVFKSCFPNSALEGNPNDPPGNSAELTVSGAEYVYNTILPYFAAHPDKLFIVITAPPLIDGAYANNARAFNQWLVNDWLRENNYALNNVAVFDFYNVLTGPDAHHRFNNGQIEHILGTNNTEYYPSEDDHPSVAGSRKATQEYIPLLNVFYHRWKASAPLQPPPMVDTPAGNESRPQPPAASSGVIDSFDSGIPANTDGWQPFLDEATSSSMTCGADSSQAHGGASSLRLEDNIVPTSWGTCTLLYQPVQDWSDKEGVTFYYHAAQPAQVFDIDIYAGNPDQKETYLYSIETAPESVNGWIPVELRWSDFHRASWEENADTPFTKTNQIVGVAFGFNAPEGASLAGTLWIDDLGFLGMQPPVVSQPPESRPNQPAATPSPIMRRPNLPCAGAIILPMMVVGLSRLRRKPRSS